MADIAQRAVFVSSTCTAAGDDTAVKATTATATRVCGPSGSFDDAHALLEHYPRIGFQATNYGKAVAIARAMLRKQPPSRVYVVQDGAFVEVAGHDDDEDDDEGNKSDALVYPTLFLGVTANLFGTGCRDAIRFLVRHGIQRRTDEKAQQDTSGCTTATTTTTQHDALPYLSFISAMVVSGGAMEHDIRRACLPYKLTHYASEAMATTRANDRDKSNGAHDCARFGNVLYDAGDVIAATRRQRQQDSTAAPPTLFDRVMHAFVARLTQHQDALAATQQQQQGKYDVCTWALTPSTVWRLAGQWLVELLEHALAAAAAAASGATDGASSSSSSSSTNDTSTRTTATATTAAVWHDEAVRRAESTVVYWAARQGVPLFCPSFVDGDIMSYIAPPDNDDDDSSNNSNNDANAQQQQEQGRRCLQIDLVGDIHALNKMAMQSKRSGMLVCGGGVVKHHVCNANLMRNGADYAIFVNNGAEYDGSDAGARPDEAVSWGKIRVDGQSVKVYSEATAVLQLLVAQVFVPAARDAMSLLTNTTTTTATTTVADDDGAGTHVARASV